MPLRIFIIFLLMLFSYNAVTSNFYYNNLNKFDAISELVNIEESWRNSMLYFYDVIKTKSQLLKNMKLLKGFQKISENRAHNVRNSIKLMMISTMGNMQDRVDDIIIEHQVFINRVHRFGTLIEETYDHNRENFVGNNLRARLKKSIKDDELDESDQIDFPIFLRWLRGEVLQGDFIKL